MSDLVEPAARAIAAHKRGLPTDHPEIDRVWSSYCGQVRAALSVLEPRIEQLEREVGWQDIETLKPELGEVLGYTPGCGYEVVRCHSSGTTYAGAFTADWVKFWRPLPPPPAGERG